MRKRCTDWKRHEGRDHGKGVRMLGRGQHKWRVSIKEPRKQGQTYSRRTGAIAGGGAQDAYAHGSFYVSNLELNKWPVEPRRHTNRSLYRFPSLTNLVDS